MQIHFTGHNLEITPPIKEYATEKLQKLTHHNKNITKLQVTLHVEKLAHIAEATAHISGVEMHATASESDMYAALDKLTDKMIAQITKHKEKQSDHHRG